MKSRIELVLILFVFFLTLGVEEASATLYCNRTYTELKKDPIKPYNAVGYLNNGCTAFLIDADHIVAAAHCFVNTTTGAWQTGLRFYPNFHPDRVAADVKHVPRSDVTSVVVGSRSGESVMGSGMDWGIARIDNWKDTAGLDLTPLALAPSIPAPGTALVNPAYTRHHFPYNDNDAVTWDNMEWDTTHCGWVGSNHGMWAIRMRPAPIHDGVNRDMVGCNSRWASGIIHANCSLSKVGNDVVEHNCDTIGGSSGSPIIYQHRKCLFSIFGNCILWNPWNKPWYVIGVGHGGGSHATATSNDFSKLVPVCAQDTPGHRDNVGASVERFRDAPRFASNVAVHRRPDNPSATAVFAVDSDLNQVVYRFRSETSPTYTSHFNFWKSLGTPYTGAKLTKIAACSADASAKPQVFVISDNEKIYTRSGLSNDNWGSWSNFGVPSSGTGVVDIDAATDAGGRCQLFIVNNAGDVFTRTKTSDTSWGSWNKVTNGSYRKIASLNYDGVLWVVMIDTDGEIWRTSLSQTGWASAIKFSRPPGISAWRDIDMTWDEYARGFMLAIPACGGNKLYFTPMYGNQPWSQWRFFETHLWAPGASPQDAPNMQSITASRWMEDPSGTTSPVVFTTDESGNVYFIEYTRVDTSRWILDWKSFYHESILYK